MVLFDMMIDIAEEELDISIRKSQIPSCWKLYKQKTRKHKSYLCTSWDRQTGYYRDIQRKNYNKNIALKVLELVKAIHITMPKVGVKKLYYMLKDELNKLK